MIVLCIQIPPDTGSIVCCIPSVCHRRITLPSECTYQCRKRELWQNVSVMSAPASAAHSHYSLYDGAEVHYGSFAALSPLAAYLLTLPSTNVHSMMYGRMHADFGFTQEQRYT